MYLGSNPDLTVGQNVLCPQYLASQLIQLQMHNFWDGVQLLE